jgi:hypothetical protein
VTPEEIERMNWLCNRIEEEQDQQRFNELVVELNTLLEWKERRIGIASSLLSHPLRIGRVVRRSVRQQNHNREAQIPPCGRWHLALISQHNFRELITCSPAQLDRRAAASDVHRSDTVSRTVRFRLQKLSLDVSARTMSHLHCKAA